MAEGRKRIERVGCEPCSGIPNQSDANPGRLLLEGSLIQRVLVGDVDSFCELVRPYQRGIYIRALSILRNKADAEEVVQETILKAFRNLVQFRNQSRFSTWFIQIAINEARIKLRKDKRYMFESLEYRLSADDGRSELNELLQSRETPLDSLEKKELCAAVSRTLNSLAPKYRSVLVLRELRELSTVDTARALGISETNVKTRLWRAHRQLRTALARSR